MLDIRHIVGAVLLFVKGLVKLIGECEDFSELEKGVHELCQDVCNQIFTWALEKIDTRREASNDTQTKEERREKGQRLTDSEAVEVIR